MTHKCLTIGCSIGYEANDGRCYKLVKTPKRGDAAQAACKAEGANLVSVGDAAENDYVHTKFG